MRKEKIQNRVALFCLFSLCLVLFGTTRGLSTELDGNFSSRWYIWEDGDQSHVRPYQSLRSRLTLWQNDSAAKLRLISYGRWTTDLADKFSNDPQLSVYDFYLSLRNLPAGSQIKLGRQFVYNGVGSVLLDGIRVDYRKSKDYAIDLFGGSSVSRLDPEEVRSLNDFLVFGGSVTYRGLADTRMVLNYMAETDKGILVNHLAGFDISRQMGSHSLFGRVVYDIEFLQISRLLGRIIHSNGKWRGSVTYEWRRPRLNGNSLFSIIDYDKQTEIRTELQRLVGSGIALSGQFDISLFDDENSYRVYGGLRNSIWLLGYRYQSGYGGENSGLIGSVRYSPVKKMEVYTRANFYKYKIQDEQTQKSEAYMLSAGFSKKFSHGINFSAEGQYLRNAVDSNDIRLYLNLTKRFSYKSDSDGE